MEDSLYLIQCRRYIPKIYLKYQNIENKILYKDYVDYYTIAYLKDDKFYDLFSSNIKLINYIDLKDIETKYSSRIILSIQPLSNYITNYQNLNKNEYSKILSRIIRPIQRKKIIYL